MRSSIHNPKPAFNPPGKHLCMSYGVTAERRLFGPHFLKNRILLCSLLGPLPCVPYACPQRLLFKDLSQAAAVAPPLLPLALASPNPFPSQPLFPHQTLYLCNSGSEANDLALRIALAACPGATHVAVMAGAYHGHLQTLIEISPYKFWGRGGQGRPTHVHVLPCPDVYRWEVPTRTAEWGDGVRACRWGEGLWV